ncbi:hypothetical protein FHG87_004510 [Trinorchestia longiramus]|nr:hypothetical protein FHG87_004510 [Trinorchestia longiramus]
MLPTVYEETDHESTVDSDTVYSSIHLRGAKVLQRKYPVNATRLVLNPHFNFSQRYPLPKLIGKMENYSSPSPKSPNHSSDAGVSDPSNESESLVASAKFISPEKAAAEASDGASGALAADSTSVDKALTPVEEKAAKESNEEGSSKPRTNGETTRSGGEEADKNGSGRRNRNDRFNNRRQRDKSTSRTSYPRNWEKTRVSGLVVTHVVSPISVYAQTPPQQHDYARLRNCMAMAYASASYRPSLVAAKMMLGMKYGDTYERVRTELQIKNAKREVPDEGDSASAPSEGASGNNAPTTAGQSVTNSTASPRWRVQLVDRGSWTEASEDELNFLLAGLADLAPLVSRYCLNELRLAKDAAFAQIEEARSWLEKELASGTIDGEIYKQPRNQSSTVFLDLYKGEKYINQALCDFSVIEPKTNFRRFKADGVRASTSSSADDAAPTSLTDASQPPEDQHGHPSGHESTPSPERDGPPKEQRQKRERSPRPSKESATEDQPPVFQEPNQQQQQQQQSNNNNRTENTGGGRRSSRWNRRDGRQRQQRLPPLHDWAVLCFDPRSSVNCLKTMCELVEHAGKDSRVPVSAADSIQLESCDDSSMVSVLADMIATHPRLLLLLCVLPHHVQDYSALERTGRNLGVCVVCVRGENIAEPNTNTATRLLKDLQTAMLNSPAILPYQAC